MQTQLRWPFSCQLLPSPGASSRSSALSPTPCRCLGTGGAHTSCSPAQQAPRPLRPWLTAAARPARSCWPCWQPAQPLRSATWWSTRWWWSARATSPRRRRARCSRCAGPAMRWRRSSPRPSPARWCRTTARAACLSSPRCSRCWWAPPRSWCTRTGCSPGTTPPPPPPWPRLWPASVQPAALSRRTPAAHTQRRQRLRCQQRAGRG
mmetsp:Transcript_12368/g.30349  ORF Transcript_12368/g.30349 Transcript_12368/m.30349 type:complete len:207 (-) Transcript_12368:2447-3067(-)